MYKGGQFSSIFIFSLLSRRFVIYWNIYRLYRILLDTVPKLNLRLLLT